MANLNKLIEGLGDSFWKKLDDAYYKKYPELWGTGDDGFSIQGPEYILILKSLINSKERIRHNGETSDNEAIYKDGYKLWVVGQKYDVKPLNIPIRNVSLDNRKEEGNKFKDGYSVTVRSNILGTIKLIKITPHDTYDTLMFEVV